MKRIQKYLIILFILSVPISSGLYSQAVEPSKNQLESVLQKFINYRFGTISVLRIKTINDIKRALREREQAESGVKIDDALLKSVDQAVLGIIERGVNAGDQLDAIRDEINAQNLNVPEKAVLENLINYYRTKGQTIQQVEDAYLITTRPERGQIPSTIISMIVTSRAGGDINKNLKFVGTNDVHTYDELKAWKLDSTYTADNMYDLMVNVLVQQNYENKTMDAQGIGNPEWFAPKSHGKTETLTSNESDVSSSDIQRFLRISDIQPTELTNLRNNEIIISPDLISWKRYPRPMYDAGAGLVPDTFGVANNELPDVGVELRYGFEDINYPSFWSERMTLSAIWQSVKLGIILPTDGWAMLSKDLFDVNRKLTYAGVGIAGSFDFPIKVIPKSGVFHINGGYVFGNANESSYKNRKILDPNFDNNYENSVNNFLENENSQYIDYLIRGNAQLHYTFGLQIDGDYWLRFGIGGTVYNVERWYNKVELTDSIPPGTRKLKFAKYNDETKGGISGKIEVMAKNIITPFGASVQYFDEALSANVWLQIPIVENIFAVRLDARSYFIAFRNEPHPWENSSVVIPMARFIVNF